MLRRNVQLEIAETSTHAGSIIQLHITEFSTLTGNALIAKVDSGGCREVSSEEEWNIIPTGWARLMEPFGASGNEAREVKPLKEMVGTRRLELLTSTVSR